MRQAKLPAGTVTFLFTDIAGSTRLLDELGEVAYASALSEHRRVVRDVCGRHGGVEVDTQGDAFFVAFPTAPGALRAATDIREGLAGSPIELRVGLHTGTPLLTREGYVGLDVHRAARIAAAGHGGQVLVSASAAALIGEPLVDLGEHRLKDLSAPERIFQAGEREFPPLRSLYRTNLPVPATVFLGREEELTGVVALLGDATIRLLTLTGPGGTGKTRLALQAAAEASDGFPDGIFWVALASLRDPGLVPGAVAAAVSLREQPGRDVQAVLGERLAGKKTMLLLDNAEHLLPDVAAPIAWLRDLDGPTVLVTSRERLRLQGEHTWPVPPLNADDGVELFLARARAVDPTIDAAGPVDELCARLDELPLAIELAAARVGVFSVGQLLDRIGDRLDLLKGMRDADPRQQTLRATIEWSYELLDSEEQRALAALAVFVGGWTLEAAEQVCETDAAVLESLIDKSLVRRRGTPAGPRYWMLETIREFASERLEADDDARALHDRHAAWAAALADELWGRSRRGQGDSFVCVEDELGNLRAAGDYAAAVHDGERALRIARTSGFYAQGGWAKDAVPGLERALELAVEADPVLRIEALRVLVFLSTRLGVRDRIMAQAEEAVALARELGDDEVLGGALAELGMALEDIDRSAARSSYEEAIRILRPLGATPELSHALPNFASVLMLEREHEAAEPLFREALELELAGISPWGPRGVAQAHLGLGEVAWYLRRDDDAYAHARQSAALCQSLGDRIGLAESLLIVAAVAATRGEAPRAGDLLGLIEHVYAEAGEQQWSGELMLRDTIFERATPEERGALDEGMRAEPALTLEQAVAESFPNL